MLKTELSRRLKWLALAAVFLLGGCAALRPLPEGVSFQGGVHPVTELEFLADLTWVDDRGERHVAQRIFDRAFDMIDSARRFVLVDMFLYNPFQGAAAEETRALSGELTDRLVARKQRYPGMEIIVITDPINTVYGGMPSPQFERLAAAGIRLVSTDLTALRDSNVLYSSIWRLLIRPFGNTADGRTLPNPFGEGRVSIRSYLSLLNFKANHRKTLIADHGEHLAGLVTSANPHDGSSAHHNVAVRFTGPATSDLLRSELAVMAFSDAELPVQADRFIAQEVAVDDALPGVRLQVLTEGKIKAALLRTIDAAASGDRLDLVMFYISDRDIISALKAASERGVRIRMLLDPNKDAFGREKNGIPNRQVARELHRTGIPVRWCDTHGEQCHSKLLAVSQADGAATVILGSANLTRRNLDDLNLETNVAVYGDGSAPFFADVRGYFGLLWRNEPGRTFSVGYDRYRDDSVSRRVLYRFMEATGISTF